MRRLFPEADREARRQGIRVVLGMLALMWALEIVNAVDGYALDRDAGIVARDGGRLWAILTAPFLHASFGHLFDNSIPFVAMGLIIALRGAARVALVTAIVVAVGGLGTWLTSPSGSLTVGASGIVFGYATYLLTRGFFNRSLLELAVGAIVAVLWGTVLLASLVPRYGVSWQGHVWGAVAGALAAWVLSGRRGAATGPWRPGRRVPATAGRPGAPPSR